MTIELIIAPPAAGKTYTCIQRIQATQKDHPLAKIWVIVPDRIQAAAFRKRLANSGGAVGVQVGRFPDLQKSILQHEGIYHPLASPSLLHRLIQDTVNDAVDQDAIPFLKPLHPFPGFIVMLRDAFAELKRALVSPEKFYDYAKGGNASQKDLATLYSRYQARLQDLQWVDSEEISQLTVDALEKHPKAASEIRLLVVDGFDSFNSSQHRLLKLLSEQVGELIITFPGAKDSMRAAHHRFSDSFERMLKDLSPIITTLENTPILPEVVGYIEKNIFIMQPPEKRSTVQPILLEARSPVDEARESLRWIKKLVIRENVALSECAVFTPNPETYHDALRSAANEFGIPISFTLDDALDNSPAINSLTNLLSLPSRNYNSRYLINTLRSPYFDFSLDPENVDTLEMVCRVGQIVEGRDQWEEVWERLIASSTQQNQDLDDERNSPNLPRGAEAERLSRVIGSIFDIITPLPQNDCLTGWISWLEDLLERLHFYEHTQSEKDRAACETFQEVLQSLVLTETVAGKREVEFSQFVSDLQAALSGEGYRESKSFGKPTLLVGRFTEARGSRFKAVALLGLSEGSFPANEHPDPFLDEQLRSDLGLELRLQREQAGLFYQAVTRTDKHLLITRPYLSDDGEEWEESAYWKAIAGLFDSSAITRINPDIPQPLVDAASSQEVLFSAVRKQELPNSYKFLAPRWKNLQHSQRVLRARRAKHAQGPFEGNAEAVSTEVSSRFHKGKKWSASRLESYGTCPFQFFVKNALELEEHLFPELGMDIAKRGTVLHRILEKTYKEAGNTADLDSLLDSLDGAAREVFSTAPKEFGFRPSILWDVEKVQLLEKLKKSINAMVEDRDWKPIAYEAKFGMDGEDPLLIDLGREKLYFKGIIDRVDHNSNGELRVVDYKTGGSHYTPKNFLQGFILQLPIYAMAAKEALKLGDPIDGIYWKIFAAEAGSLKLAKIQTDDAVGVDAAIEITCKHLVRILNGIRSAQYSPKKPDDGCPPYCVAAKICWRFEPGD